MKADIGIPDKPIFFRLPNIGELNMYSLFLRDAFIAGDLFLITFFVGDCVFGFIIISPGHINLNRRCGRIHIETDSYRRRLFEVSH